MVIRSSAFWNRITGDRRKVERGGRLERERQRRKREREMFDFEAKEFPSKTENRSSISARKSSIFFGFVSGIRCFYANFMLIKAPG